MKTKLLIIFILVGFGQVQADTTAKKQPVTATKQSVKKTSQKPVVVAPKTKTSNLTTDAKFDGQTVGGKYQLPMEALSVVENEKEIDDLIGVRKNFRDRVARTKGMR